MKWKIAVCDDDRTDAKKIGTALTEYLKNAGELYSCQTFLSGRALE